MAKMLPFATSPPEVSFHNWGFDRFDLGEVIAKQVEAVLTEAMQDDDGAYAALSSSGPPLTILVGWPFSDGFMQASLREMFVEFLEDYRPGGEGSGEAIEDDDGKVAEQISALRKLADDMEKLAGK